MNIKEEGLKEFKKQIDPNDSEFECFFHYTDDLLFAAGFVKGYVFKEENKVSAIDDKHLKVKTAAGFTTDINTFARIANIFSLRKEISLKILSTPPGNRMQEAQLSLFDYYNEQIQQYLGL